MDEKKLVFPGIGEKIMQKTRKEALMRKLDNRGGSMVEIMVGFVLILIIIASFMQIIKLSSNMTMDSSERKEKLVALQDEFYSGVNDDSESSTSNGKKFSIKAVAGEKKDSAGPISNIQLVECDADGKSIDINQAVFDLKHATIYEIESLDNTGQVYVREPSKEIKGAFSIVPYKE